MQWNLIKTWAREHGYDVLKEKGKDSYIWTKVDDPSITGITDNLRQLSIDIYNHMTDNKWLDYQKEYAKTKEIHISFNEY